MHLSTHRLLSLSPIRRIVLPGANGRMHWVEMSNKFIPPGGKKLKVGYSTFVILIGSGSFIFYAYVQSILNPDSSYKRALDWIYNAVPTAHDARLQVHKDREDYVARKGSLIF